MKVCIPIAADQGLESEVFGHFGAAPAFVLVDTDSKNVEQIDYSNDHSEHGQCAPVGAISQHNVDAVIVGGIGRGASNRFMAAGIEVYLGRPGTVAQMLDALANGELQMVGAEGTCQGHQRH